MAKKIPLDLRFSSDELDWAKTFPNGKVADNYLDQLHDQLSHISPRRPPSEPWEWGLLRQAELLSGWIHHLRVSKGGKARCRVNYTQDEGDHGRYVDCVYVECMEAGGVGYGPVWGHGERSVKRALFSLKKVCGCGISWHEEASEEDLEADGLGPGQVSSRPGPPLI